MAVLFMLLIVLVVVGEEQLEVEEEVEEEEPGSGHELLCNRASAQCAKCECWRSAAPHAPRW